MSALTVTDETLLAFVEEVGANDAVAVEGSRSRWSLGGALADGTRLVSAPSGVVAYAAPEMTVQVRAGTSVAELDAALAQNGQRSALPDRGGTVGGAIAVGENVLDVLARGRLRDAVLQVRYVSAEGRVITGGGPVVKNVTGFNIPKLMTGSMGTLGLFAEFILRCNPIPSTHRWLSACDVDPVAVLDALYRPAAVLWDGTTTWVHLEGYGVDVDAESGILRNLGGFAEVEGPPARPQHRWSLTPATAAALPDRGLDTGGFLASIGVGLVWAERPAPVPATEGTGTASVTARLKEYFDPTGRLNPGRRVGG